MDQEEIKKRFEPHPMNETRKLLSEEVRAQANLLATRINHAPDSREKSIAMTKLEEAVFWANAALARNP